jgi:DNA-binding MarR family transcriptional regulator
MHELEEVSVFTRSGVTRLADRLEAAGLVRRERSQEDRRGVYW